MAYIDLTKITSIYAQNIITEDSALAGLALEEAEVLTRIVARELEVKTEDIPLDGSGYLQSEMLYIYCKWAFIFSLFDGVNGSYELDDIYTREKLFAEHKMQTTRDSLSYSIITEEEVVAPEKRNSGIPIL
jgi:hypothetical protein